jgi:hypothetical protein
MAIAWALSSSAAELPKAITKATESAWARRRVMELVFCCPQCLHISSTGISANFDTIVHSLHRPIHVSCKACRRFNFIVVDHALMSTSFGADGTFASLLADDWDAEESAMQALHRSSRADNLARGRGAPSL